MVGGGADALQSSPCFDETQLSTKHSTILLVGVEFTLGAKHKVIRMRDLNILNQSKSLTLVYLVPFVVRGGMFLSVDGNTSVDKFIVYDVVHLHDFIFTPGVINVTDVGDHVGSVGTSGIINSLRGALRQLQPDAVGDPQAARFIAWPHRREQFWRLVGRLGGGRFEVECQAWWGVS